MSQLKLLFEASEPEPFDVYGPLPSGVTLLEASAGTGKTFTIAALVARHVAEGLPLERLLVVTFTRMATGELRDRVRHRLVTAAAGLGQTMAGVEPSDDLVKLLAEGKPKEVAARHRRLLTAVAEFDAATIDTTHGFCLHVLMGLGVAGDTERDVKLVEDVADLLEEVVDDLYVRRFWNGDSEPNFDRAVAMSVSRAVVGRSSARLSPSLSEERSNAAMRRRLADAVRSEVERRKRQAGIVTYDDLLTRLCDALGNPTSGSAARGRLAGRYEVVLVDEFQDTDPVQWEILDLAFRASNLVLIGDPKQAIYAFRGADVFAYLNAARSVEKRATLRVNWRSDAGLIAALDAIFAGAQLGQAGIAYHPVEAAPGNEGYGISGAPCGTPLRVRLLERTRLVESGKGLPAVQVARDRIARDLADDVSDLLSSGAEIVDHRGARQVSPGDVAVLVRANSHAVTVRDALVACGVPAVVAGGGSVFSTAPASEWNRLLSAMEKPTSRPLAAAASLTQFVGWTGDQVAGASDGDWEDLHWKLARWSAVLRSRGVAALVEQITAAGLPERVLALQSGERFLTDLLHVGRLLHGAATEESLGTASLVVWLRRRLREAADRNDEEMSLRLESDAEAVQVLTIHRSKGLEFPVVYYPYAWDGYIHSDRVVPVFHDPDWGYELTVDVGGERVGFTEHKKLEHDEQRGEDLRLLYVALTRAKHQVVLWWVPTKEGGKSPLSRFLFNRDGEGVVSPHGGSTPEDAEVRTLFEDLAAGVPGCISVESVEDRRVEPWAPDSADDAQLEVARFDRELDSIWRRTSYSGITAAAHDGFRQATGGERVGSEHEESLLTDENDRPAVASAAVPSSYPALLLSGMPGGVEVGSFVHSVLEDTDFAATDLQAELRRAISEATNRRAVDVGDPDRLVAGLSATIGTPLGPIAGGARLRDVERPDRLDELNFEIPVAGGDSPRGSVSTRDIARIVRSHCGADDPLGSYCDRLEDPEIDQDVRGYLMGSIDLACRLAGGKFVIVDYKTNRLAAADTEVTAWHFRPEALVAEMHRAHYPLQAILYSVAFHRYMRWRDPSWDPDRDFAGVLYLFVRGMSAPEQATNGAEPCGVWSWRPPSGLLAELSELFDVGADRP